MHEADSSDGDSIGMKDGRVGSSSEHDGMGGRPQVGVRSMSSGTSA